MEPSDGVQRTNGPQHPTPSTSSPTTSNLTSSTSFASSNGPSSENHASSQEFQPTLEQPKFFFNEKYAKLGVKGNFMPLAAQPVNVDLADWLAHQSKLRKPCHHIHSLTLD